MALENGGGDGEVVPIAIIEREDGETLRGIARGEPPDGLIEADAIIAKFAHAADGGIEKAGRYFENAIGSEIGAIRLAHAMEHENDARALQPAGGDAVRAACMHGKKRRPCPGGFEGGFRRDYGARECHVWSSPLNGCRLKSSMRLAAMALWREWLSGIEKEFPRSGLSNPGIVPI